MVGVEANPALVEQVRSALGTYVASGQLTLLNVGIGAEDGVMTFWVCDDVSEWSSFHRELAARDNAKHHPIEVPTVRFTRLMDEFGVPHYCKIDIEGNDDLCLQGLSAQQLPAYLSYEMPLRDGLGDLEHLHGLGYRRFKVVSQVTRTQPSRLMTRLAATLNVTSRDRLHRLQRRFPGSTRDGDWQFALGSSQAPSPAFARRYDGALALSVGSRSRILAGRLGDWFDIHVTS